MVRRSYLFSTGVSSRGGAGVGQLPRQPSYASWLSCKHSARACSIASLTGGQMSSRDIFSVSHLIRHSALVSAKIAPGRNSRISNIARIRNDRMVSPVLFETVSTNLPSYKTTHSMFYHAPILDNQVAIIISSMACTMQVQCIATAVKFSIDCPAACCTSGAPPVAALIPSSFRDRSSSPPGSRLSARSARTL
jgi:hypothetical protein